MPTVKQFKDGMRVRVRRDCEGLTVGALGTVVRLRRSDKAAWVSLYTRHEDARVHPFPAGDHRDTHVLALPEDCEELA